jgi:hypothetical protein
MGTTSSDSSSAPKTIRRPPRAIWLHYYSPDCRTPQLALSARGSPDFGNRAKKCSNGSIAAAKVGSMEAYHYWIVFVGVLALALVGLIFHELRFF